MLYLSEDEVNGNPKCSKTVVQNKMNSWARETSRPTQNTSTTTVLGKRYPGSSWDRNRSSRPLRPLEWHSHLEHSSTAAQQQSSWTNQQQGKWQKKLALWVQVKPTDTSSQAWWEYVDQILKSKMPEIKQHPWEWGWRRKKRSMFPSLGEV